MGLCMEHHGRVLVEVRGESFKIHAGYAGINDALAALWSRYPHPEFIVDDIDDLIAALQEARTHIRGERK